MIYVYFYYRLLVYPRSRASGDTFPPRTSTRTAGYPEVTQPHTTPLLYTHTTSRSKRFNHVPVPGQRANPKSRNRTPHHYCTHIPHHAASSKGKPTSTQVPVTNPTNQSKVLTKPTTRARRNHVVASTENVARAADSFTYTICIHIMYAHTPARDHASLPIQRRPPLLECIFGQIPYSRRWDTVRYSGIQLDIARYVRIQLDIAGYSGIQWICCDAKWLDML